MGAMGRIGNCVSLRQPHMFLIGELNIACVCARVHVHVYLSVCKGTLAVVFLSDCVFQFL